MKFLFQTNDRPIGERLEQKTERVPFSGCWIWTGATSDAGYGQLRVGGSAKYVHRLSWETHRGPIPAGLEIDHLCRVRCCLNPDHLEPVTGKINVLRGTSPMADLAKMAHCVHGHPLSGANLYSRPDGKGRMCLACDHARKKTRRYMDVRNARRRKASANKA